MIKVENLCKHYGKLSVLEDITLEIEKGDIYGLVGKSGVGKSTLLRCLNGLEEFRSGKIVINDTDINSLDNRQLREFRKNMGMIFQNFSLLERKTVYENIALPMKCWKFSKSEIDKKIKQLVKTVGMEDKLNVKAKNLSGGQKQRVAIARALSLDPKILLCDEATSALDPGTTNNILNLLKDINRELDITIVVVTHQMNVIQQICNKVALLEHGRIVENGYVEDIFLNQSDALKKLTCKMEEKLPLKGVNIEVFSTSSEFNFKILSEMAIKLNVLFSIVGGAMEQYRDKKLGRFIINVESEDRDKVLKFLEENKVEYSVL